MNTALEALEQAAFEAWPSASTRNFKGWTLRLDRGYTKRANSINASAAAQSLGEADIDVVEEAFTSRRLASVWRVTSLANVDDELLKRRGYRFAERSLVMTRSLAAGDAAWPSTRLEGPEPWLRAYQRASGNPREGQDAHLQILQRIARPCAWAASVDAGGDVAACGLGVLVGEAVGIFDVVTAASHRGQGRATELCRGLMAWGVEQGACLAFLQVTEANGAAVRLYRRLGFETAYTYGYYLKT